MAEKNQKVAFSTLRNSSESAFSALPRGLGWKLEENHWEKSKSRVFDVEDLPKQHGKQKVAETSILTLRTNFSGFFIFEKNREIAYDT